MRFKKKELAELARCYAVSEMSTGKRDYFLFATEGNGKCISFRYPDFAQGTVWEQPGGTMSMIPIPGTQGEFLAVQLFLPTFNSAEAKVVWVSPTGDNRWKVKDFINLPYLHRFDVIASHGKNYFIGAALCTSKQFKDDWSDPGKIYVGVIPERPEDGMTITPVYEGLTKNHGYTRAVLDGVECGVVTSDEGIFKVVPPQNGSDWVVEQISDIATSDVAFVDIDGDGQPEMVTIEPFHGKRFCIRKKTEQGYQIIYEYAKKMNFAHVVWGGTLCGKPAIIGGYRREGKELFVVTCTDAKNLVFHTQTVDRGTGPSNVHVVHKDGRDIILSANREIGRAVIYEVYES